MHFPALRRLPRFLLLVLAVLFILWLALPRLLGFAAERWIAVPGVGIERVDIAAIGGGQARLRELRASYQTAGGHRLQIALHDMVLDYSPLRRHVDLLSVARAEVSVLPGEARQPQPWPQLTWPQLPLSEIRVRDLRLAVSRAGLPPLAVQGSLVVRHGPERQLQAEFRPANGLLELALAPGEMLEAGARWLPEHGPGAGATLRIGRHPARQPASLIAQADPSALLSLGEALGITLPVTAAQGEIRVTAEATLGEFSGELRALRGELGVAQFALQTAAGAARPLSAALAGKAHFAWAQPGQGASSQGSVELQPGLTWQLDIAGAQPLQLAGQLQTTFAMRLADGVAGSQAELPFTLHSLQSGRWQGALSQLQLRTGASSLDINEVMARMRITGLLPHWRHGLLQARAVQASGTAGVRWRPDTGLNADTHLQIQAERMQVGGKTPWQVEKSQWTVQAEASAMPGRDLLDSLELRGEAASRTLQVVRGNAAALVLGPTSLRAVRFRPAQQQGEFLLAADTVKLGGWPAPDVRSRVVLRGQNVEATGSLQLKQTPVFRFSATHALGQGCGRGLVTISQDLAVLGQALQPRSPALRPLDLQAGQAEGRFDLAWCARPELVLDARGSLKAHGVELGWEQARLAGLGLNLQLASLKALQGRIQLDAKRGQLATGTALADFKLDLALAPGTLQVDALQLKLLGGSVNAGPQTLPWPLAGQSLPLEIRDLDLGQVLALFKQPGLSGSGLLGGVLPLSYRDGALEVRDGQLSSPRGGTLKYAPTLAIPDNPGLQALRNLHFEKLDMHVWYAPGGAYRTQIKLDGRNPDFYNGYPVRFGLNINGALPGLFRAALFSGDFNRHILEQLQSGKLQ